MADALLNQLNFVAMGPGLRRDDGGETLPSNYAVTASISSSSSSSIGAKVESGFVDSVIGLRLPEVDTVERAAGSRDRA